MGERYRESAGESLSRVYVGNLPGDAEKRDLEDLFQKYGRIAHVNLKRNTSGGAFAFLEFEDSRDAEDAIRGRDGYNFRGGRLRVEVPFAARNGGGSKSRGPHRRGEYRVQITGLPTSGSWQDLKDHMRDAGECVFADVYGNGVGVVEFSRKDDMEYAIRTFDGSKFRSHEGENARITVSRAEDGGGGSRSRSRSGDRYHPRRSGCRFSERDSRDRHGDDRGREREDRGRERYPPDDRMMGESRGRSSRGPMDNGYGPRKDRRSRSRTPEHRR